MRSKIRAFFKPFIEVEPSERLKLFLLTASFFLIIAAYTLVKELKDSIFIGIVGKEYASWAGMASTIILVPAILFYSFLVDKIRRYQLLYFYSILYGSVGLVCTYLLADPVIGIQNTQTSPYRLFGWFFYFFIEGFSPFVVSVFWSFANSVNSPEAAKHNYALLVSGSKVGGLLTAGLAWWMLYYRSPNGCRIFSDVASHQVILGSFSILVFLVPVAIYFLITKVPGRYLHGYEAVYKIEKEKKAEKPSLFAGLTMLLRWPYIMGIFGMLFFYEVVGRVLSYQRLGVAQAASSDISEISCFFFKIAFLQHLIGIFISFVGTRKLLNWLGEKNCLLFVPISTGLLLLYLLLNYTPGTMVFTLILLRSINYAFAQPVRESLYIPTVKDIKFKSKSWIDSFGGKLAKTVGSGFNQFAEVAGPTLFFPIHSAFFLGIVILWFITAYLLGNRFNKAVENNEVIGVEAV